MEIRTFLYFTPKGLQNRNGCVGYKDIEIYLRIIRPNPTHQITARDLIRLNLVRNQARPGLGVRSGVRSGEPRVHAGETSQEEQAAKAKTLKQNSKLDLG